MKDNIIVDQNVNYTYVAVAYNRLKNEQVQQWLVEYEGKGHYARGGNGIYFECDDDATLFALKWS